MAAPLELILKPYTLGQLQDAIGLLKAIDENGYAFKDIVQYLHISIQEKRDELDATYRALPIHRRPRCPECSQYMLLMEVNNTPCTMIGGTAQTMWFCADIVGCGSFQTSDKNITDELESRGIPYSPPTPQTEQNTTDVSKRNRAAQANRSRSTPRTQEPKNCGGRK